ncbi:YggT family protein [Caldovatus aquaticus]|uniref:YggT family protein n=1 Tax=Caldovatus aquaticus TaxID=2865671 RepID=A0ABS7F2P5_9PROT|nr:YggT family protein [Caldovatus aquaticus]MBW8269881.1 YggT family protein [Caldovatus aquaticus]
MDGTHFLFGYLPFWVVNYGLAVVGWTCLGRFALQWAVPPDSPNYIWRAFRRLTDWALALARLLVPRYVAAAFLPLVAAFWIWVIRLLFGLAMLAAGWAPRLGSAASAAG